MFRIIALNDDDTDRRCDEIQIAKEAQETLAESEYLRVLRLRKEGKVDLASALINQLLNTRVLNETATDDARKLSSIRYNCYKLLAIINEEKREYDASLNNYISALQLDSSDINTAHRLGKLALSLEQLELAEYAFESCLRQNKRHWSAANGLLKVYAKNNNFFASYWLIRELMKNKICTKQATQLLNNTFYYLKSCVPLFQQFFGEMYNTNILSNEIPFTEKTHLSIRTTDDPLVLPFAVTKFRVSNISFLSIGYYILRTVKELRENNISLLFALSFQDMCCLESELLKEPITENADGITKIETEPIAVDYQNVEQKDINVFSDSIANEGKCEEEATSDVIIDLDSTPKADDDTNKTKSRRRCSDLHLLEQWGWHKNRRNTRKKTGQDRSTCDATLAGFLKKAFVSLLNENYSEFLTYGPSGSVSTIKQCDKCIDTILLEDFEKETVDDLNAFVGSLKAINFFDIMALSFKWLCRISKYWTRTLPNELKAVYIELFLLYMNCYNFSTWNQLSSSTLASSYGVCLYFLELQYAHIIENKLEIPGEWLQVFHHLTHTYGVLASVEPGTAGIIRMRLLNLEYLQTNFHSRFLESLKILEMIIQLLCSKEENHEIHLPHLSAFCIVLHNSERMRNQVKRKIQLKRIPIMFAKKQWTELSVLISEDISNNSMNVQKDENTLQDFQRLNQLLLQCHWNNHMYEECLVAAEKWLNYAASNYFQEHNRIWAESITYALSYIEAIILNEGYDMVTVLNDCLSRLIQNLIRILSYQLDGDGTKKDYASDEMEMRRSWIVLHQILMREENIKLHTSEISNLDADCDNDLLPMSFVLLFTAHEYLGKRQACTSDNGVFLQYIMNAVIPNLRAPIYDDCRNCVYEYIEQITYCMYGFPPKRARSHHLEDHNSTRTEMDCKIATDIFDLYAPENLPEFNSYKVESISSDMEQLILKILLLMPSEFESFEAVNNVRNFIDGDLFELSQESFFELPYKIKNIYYLLADFYFKSRDFNKAIKYYTLDIAANPTRFDSWAGISLSKASYIETKLNGLTQIDLLQFFNESGTVIRCFNKCISFLQNHVLLWIEYGSFAYTIGSFCSRMYKKCQTENDTKWLDALNEKKNEMFNIACNCFTLASGLQSSDYSESESNEEKWLCQYMLGKISEKRKEKPNVYLKYYLTAANLLYECNATYPIKLNHSNPTALSVEALEVYYRTNAAIMKFCPFEHDEQHIFTKEIVILFRNVLKKLSNSPFAFNKAKIDGKLLLKRKNSTTADHGPSKKLAVDTSESISQQETAAAAGNKDCNSIKINAKVIGCQPDKNSRRSSLESSITVTSSSASSIYESDSESSSMDNQPDNVFDITAEMEKIYDEVIKNLEECVIRFPEHYKSIYRLVHIYMYGPSRLRDLAKCENLLLNQYRTKVGNIINGLFFDRKTNNLFNGIWRIPSSEIDRPGSFSAHLIKCVNALIELLKKQNNYKMIVDIAIQLYKTPDIDKRYIMDVERTDLYKKAINYCENILREQLESHKSERDDTELLNLLIDIYKIQKKCYKYMLPKDVCFSKVLSDVYVFYIENKVDMMPKSVNFVDLAVKLCVQEINYRKNLEKMSNLPGSDAGSNYLSLSQKNRTIFIPGINVRNRMQQSATTESMMTTTVMERMTTLSSAANLATSEDLANYTYLLQYCKQMLENTPNENTVQTKFTQEVPINLMNPANAPDEAQDKTEDKTMS